MLWCISLMWKHCFSGQMVNHHSVSFSDFFPPANYGNHHHSCWAQMTQYVSSFFLIVPQPAVHVLAFAGCSTLNLISEDRNRHARHILISLLLWSIYQFSRGGNELIQTKQNASPVFERELNDKQFCWVGAKLTSVSFDFSHGRRFNFIHSYFSFKTRTTWGTYFLLYWFAVMNLKYISGI